MYDENHKNDSQDVLILIINVQDVRDIIVALSTTG